MPTFPKSLVLFQKMVHERGAQLRERGLEELKQLAGAPIEQVTVESCPATIGVIVQSLPNGGIRVVVQGFIKAFIGQHLALDGFYKYPDESVTPIPYPQFSEFD